MTVSDEIQSVHRLSQQFLEMVRERKGHQLRAWMEEAGKSGIPELKASWQELSAIMMQ